MSGATSAVQTTVLTLPWLRLLRWTAVVGQSVTVLWVVYGLKIPLPLVPVFACIGVTALTNLGLHHVPKGVGETPVAIAACLAMDVLVLTVLLHLTGGPHNPFSTFYLAHVALAAVALTPRWSILVAACCSGGYGLLFLSREILPQPDDAVCGVGPTLPIRLHLQGMLVAFVLTALAIVFFAGRLQQTLRRRDSELAAARSVASNHERFAALATLAAGAAHELGTPLGTIAIAAGEVGRAARLLIGQTDLVDDADLIREEAARCRMILDRLQEQSGDLPRQIQLSELVWQLRDRFPQRLELQVTTQSETFLAPPEALFQAISSLVKNGLDASGPEGVVRCVMTVDAQQVSFRIANRGDGLSPEVRAHAGEPFFTTKPPGRGTGLGLFLVRLLAERLGGTFLLQSLPGETVATIQWPQRTGSARFHR